VPPLPTTPDERAHYIAAGVALIESDPLILAEIIGDFVNEVSRVPEPIEEVKASN